MRIFISSSLSNHLEYFNQVVENDNADETDQNENKNLDVSETEI